VVGARAAGVSQTNVERTLLEGAVNSAFAQVDAGKLPLDPSTKALLAEFIGTRISRGVAYRQLRREFLPCQEPMLRERVASSSAPMRCIDWPRPRSTT
jgi:hypothetical protein